MRGVGPHAARVNGARRDHESRKTGCAFWMQMNNSPMFVERRYKIGSDCRERSAEIENITSLFLSLSLGMCCGQQTAENAWWRKILYPFVLAGSLIGQNFDRPVDCRERSAETKNALPPCSYRLVWRDRISSKLPRTFGGETENTLSSDSCWLGY